jgi:exonuclease SbcC
MIITGIQAKNILKYAELELNELPEEGMIAISGPNESGKSTIGETVCFALFGRTFSLGEDELEKLIRWGEHDCSVRVTFRTGDGEHYEIARFLDRDGNQGARLNLVGAEEEPIARGAETVGDATYDLLGFNFEEFVESFYLAQREITTPHPHSHAVKTMAGLSSLEQVSREYDGEIVEEQSNVEGRQREIADIDRDLEELDLQEGQLLELEGERVALADEDELANQHIEELEAASLAYQDAYTKIQSARSSSGRAGLLRFVLLLLALASGAAWGLVAHMPEHSLTGALQTFLTDNLPQWNQAMVPWLLYGAGGFAVLFLLMWWRVTALKRRIVTLQTASTELSGKLNELHSSVPENPEEDTAAEEGEEDSSANPLSDSELSHIGGRIAETRAVPEEVRNAVGRELAWMRRESQKVQEGIVRLDQAIYVENERISKGGKLNELRDSLEERLAEHQNRIYLRELALDLLQGASRHVSQRFNRDLRDLVGRTLPMFTENRYEHLQIGDDLTVRVFSSEKRDYLDLEEISSGTQRQIMLAVRLALSQELVNRVVDGRQFLFLDEPFAFFDQERTRSALQVLPDLSDEITQTWIIAQEFPGEHEFDLSVNCSRDVVALTTEE